MDKPVVAKGLNLLVQFVAFCLERALTCLAPDEIHFAELSTTSDA